MVETNTYYITKVSKKQAKNAKFKKRQEKPDFVHKLDIKNQYNTFERKMEEANERYYNFSSR